MERAGLDPRLADGGGRPFDDVLRWREPSRKGRHRQVIASEPEGRGRRTERVGGQPGGHVDERGVARAVERGAERDGPERFALGVDEAPAADDDLGRARHARVGRLSGSERGGRGDDLERRARRVTALDGAREAARRSAHDGTHLTARRVDRDQRRRLGHALQGLPRQPLDAGVDARLH